MDEITFGMLFLIGFYASLFFVVWTIEKEDNNDH